MTSRDTTMTTPAIGTTDTRPPTGGDVERIKAGIERTQADLADTMAELQRKLSPSHVYGRAKDAARDTLQAWGNTGLSVAAIAYTQAEVATRRAGTTLRRNPAPAALIGAGVAAALFHGLRRRSRSRLDRDGRPS
jgi:hypothetical protein